MIETSRRVRPRAGKDAVDRTMIYHPAATGEATDHAPSSDGEQSPSFLLLSSNSAPVPRSENVVLRID